MAGKVAVILGGTGMVGASMAQRLEREGDWQVTIVSRRAPDFPTRARHVACDMADPADCARGLGGLGDTTHVFWTGHATGTQWVGKAQRDADLFRNAMTALEAAAPRLQHVCLLQGSKYYGRHLGPFKTPAREDDPRHFPPNFYYTQEDFLKQLAEGKRWSWSLMRPHIVCGNNAHSDINVCKPLAVYATLCRKLGLPLRFPGPEAAFRAVHCASDVELLNQGMLWAATTPGCANQAFNMVNGDHFRWQHLWPKFAAFFGLADGGVQQIDLELMMADKAALWDEIVREHGLAPMPFPQPANWAFANYTFAATWDVMLDNTKARKFGFAPFVDSEEMFLRIFENFRRQRVIP